MCEQTLIHTCSQEYPGSARCVQSFDDSLDSAIRITYRISLRSSSMREPRHPSLKVVWHSVSPRRRAGLPNPNRRRGPKGHTHARGSDWSQSRDGGRFKRFWLWFENKKGSPEVVAPRTTPTPRTYNRFVTMVHRVVEFGMDVFV